MGRIRVWITSHDCDGKTNSMDFDGLDDVFLLTCNLGKHCELTFEELKDEEKGGE